MKFMISFTHTNGEMADRVPRWNELTDDEKRSLGDHLKELADKLQNEQNTNMIFFGNPDNAQTVHLDRDGNLEVGEGTLLEGDEFVGGYYIINVDSKEEALDWAKQTRWLVGTNEVRQIVTPEA